MHGIAERVENGRNLAVDAGIMPPDVAHWQRDIFRECARTVDADALGVSAQMAPARQAITATAANDVAFAAHDRARMEVVHIGANLDDFADKLVSDCHWDRNGGSRPIVPLINV